MILCCHSMPWQACNRSSFSLKTGSLAPCVYIESLTLVLITVALQCLTDTPCCRFIWRVHPSFEQIGITLITSLWPDLPAHIDAAYENTNKNSMLVFKGEAFMAQRHHKNNGIVSVLYVSLRLSILGGELSPGKAWISKKHLGIWIPIHC